jgi:hypothetical protein
LKQLCWSGIVEACVRHRRSRAVSPLPARFGTNGATRRRSPRLWSCPRVWTTLQRSHAIFSGAVPAWSALRASRPVAPSRRHPPPERPRRRQSSRRERRDDWNSLGKPLARVFDVGAGREAGRAAGPQPRQQNLGSINSNLRSVSGHHIGRGGATHEQAYEGALHSHGGKPEQPGGKRRCLVRIGQVRSD